ncbi:MULTISPECIES: hypothetical protein, partial [Mesorhizobium]|uniref:hypothetical protein n=1 Tax=Mesorhizobium TaxID=68287 RepID=UPI0019D13AA2
IVMRGAFQVSKGFVRNVQVIGSAVTRALAFFHVGNSELVDCRIVALEDQNRGGTAHINFTVATKTLVLGNLGATANISVPLQVIRCGRDERDAVAPGCAGI